MTYRIDSPVLRDHVNASTALGAFLAARRLRAYGRRHLAASSLPQEVLVRRGERVVARIPIF